MEITISIKIISINRLQKDDKLCNCLEENQKLIITLKRRKGVAEIYCLCSMLKKRMDLIFLKLNQKKQHRK